MFPHDKNDQTIGNVPDRHECIINNKYWETPYGD